MIKSDGLDMALQAMTIRHGAGPGDGAIDGAQIDADHQPETVTLAGDDPDGKLSKILGAGSNPQNR